MESYGAHGQTGPPPRNEKVAEDQEEDSEEEEEEECDMERWLTFVPVGPGFDVASLECLCLCEDDLPYVTISSVKNIDKWLQRYPPSEVRSSDGIAWICVRELVLTKESYEGRDVDGLQQAWQELQQSGRIITHQAIKDLAKNYHYVSGKWMIFAESGPKVDILWRMVAKGICEGKLGAKTSAKVSSENFPKEKMHVICIYNEDYTNMDNVAKLEGSLRSIGIKGTLVYKPTVYTILGVYGRNQWGLRPTIYRSQYNVMTRSSEIVEIQ